MPLRLQRRDHRRHALITNGAELVRLKGACGRSTDQDAPTATVVVATLSATLAGTTGGVEACKGTASGSIEGDSRRPKIRSIPATRVYRRTPAESMQRTEGT